ncbi:MAG: FAD binding domain-containing protein [Thermoplasmata archaeon]
MHLDPFELHRPESVEETVRLAQELAPGFDYLAGGTDLLPNYKMHLNVRPHLIALDRVPDLQGYDLSRIGAMARLADLDSDPEVARNYPALGEAVHGVATPLVRASGTVGGNLLVETRCFFFNQSFFWRASLGFCLKADGDRCHVVPQKEKCYATFSGDLAPALEVLGATVELAGPDGRRRLPLDDLYSAEGDGIQRHHLRPGELLVAVHLPPEARRRRSTYTKLRPRPSFDFPELGLAVSLVRDGDQLTALEIAAGGLETYPRRFPGITQGYVGGSLSGDRIGELARAVQGAVRPVHNTAYPPDYRKRMTGVFVRRAVTSLWERRGAS